VAARAVVASAALVAGAGSMSLSHKPIRSRDATRAPLLPNTIPPLLRRIYAARGITGPEQLATGLEALLPVSGLEGAVLAAELLLAHQGGRILVIGDFDADGATSTALMLRALSNWGFQSVDFLVPDRFKYGYGLTPGIVAEASTRQPTLIVTVDNGMSSIEGVAAARALGIAVLITDHHLPGAALPDANAIVNPNLAGSSFGSRALAGVGVAFYVLAAVQRLLQSSGKWRDANRPVTQWLDLVALGTVADLVSLDVNNRILVEQGLRRIRAGQCVPGMRALLEIAKRSAADMVAADLGFAVGPRLNAAGRLDDMSIGIRCLLSDDPLQARSLASELDVLNGQRREIEAGMQVQAQAAVRHLGPLATDSRRVALCLFDATWHQGVVGLVASRIKDRVGRPVVAFAPAGDGGQLRGSARSIAGIHIRDVFEAMAARDPGLIVRFGGHAMAAGLTLDAARLDDFARAFEAQVAEWMHGVDPDDAIWTDGQLDEADMDLATAQLLRAAGPWGQAFPEPSFDGDFDIESTRVLAGRHVKFWVRPAGSRARFDAIAFNLLEPEGRSSPPAGRVRLAYRLDVNHYQGERRLQLLVDHVQETP
jgi:single-stranded-DNA-specific exonuclease